MAYFPPIGSVVAFQSNPSSLLTGASIIGLTPVNVTNMPSVYGNISGSVVAFQGNSPWANTNVGSIITIGQGSVAVVIIGGSILTSSTANQSVSGAVSVSNFPTTQNVSGSVVATQGTNPWTITSSIAGGIFPISGSVSAVVTNTVTVVSSISGGIFPVSGSVSAVITNTPNVNTAGSVVAFQGTSPWVVNYQNSSIITVSSGSIAAVIIGGSILTSSTANQSVSGTVGASVIGNVNTTITSIATAGQVMGSIATLQGTNPWIITGSVQGAFSPSGNQSVSGTVQTQVQASVAVVIIGGSILTSSTANQSVSGTVGASIIGQLPTGTAMIGSVVAYQGAIPWTISSVYGNISGSVAATITNTNVNVSGSVVAFVTNNPSVSGTVGASIIGIAPITLTANTIPATASILVGVTANTNGSVLTTTGYPQAVMQITSGPGASITGQVNFEGTMDGTQFVPIQGYNIATGAIASAAGIESDWAFNVAGLQGMRGRVSNWTVGSITAIAKVSPSDARPLATTLVGNPSISGTILIGGQPIAVTPNFSSIIAINAGSVVTLSSGSIIAVLQSSSVITTWKDSSVLSAQQGTWRTSVTGTTAANSASIISGLGFVTMGVRNDGMGSVLSTTDGFYGPFATGQWGDQIVSIAPASVWTAGVGSVYTGTPQPIIGSVSGRFLNVTGIQVANASANNVYLTFYGTGLGSVAGSIIGYTVAPANGGSNINYPVPLRTQVSQPFQASVSGVASVLISAQGFYSKV